jgi:hypothetical protein
MKPNEKIPTGARVKFLEEIKFELEPLGVSEGTVEGLAPATFLGLQITSYVVRFDNPVRRSDGQLVCCAVIPSDMLYAADPS